MLRVPENLFQTAGKPNNYLFYLKYLIKRKDNIGHKLLRPSQFLEKNPEFLAWSTFQK